MLRAEAYCNVMRVFQVAAIQAFQQGSLLICELSDEHNWQEILKRNRMLKLVFDIVCEKASHETRLYLDACFDHH